MKILFGMPDKNSWGGVQNCEPPFVAALKSLGVETAEETYVWGEKLNKITARRRVERVLKTALRFRKLLRENDFDIVHLNTAFDMKAVMRDVATVSLIRNRKTKIFVKFHGSEKKLLEHPSLSKWVLWRHLLKTVDGIGVLSSEEKQNFIETGVAKDKIFVVKNAVRVPENLPERNFNAKPFRLLFVSRFIRTKGLEETCYATYRLLQGGFDVTLDCLGDGQERAWVENMFKPVSKYIRFHGYVPEEKVNEFYRNSDALVFPTRHPEGFPMVIFNAVAHGLPIVTTKIRAAADYLSEPENVLWTKKWQQTDDCEDLCQKVDLLYQKPELCRQMSENNRRLARNFTAEKIAPQYLEIYERLIRRS